jgi:hypothetical protein
MPARVSMVRSDSEGRDLRAWCGAVLGGAPKRESDPEWLVSSLAVLCGDMGEVGEPSTRRSSGWASLAAGAWKPGRISMLCRLAPAGVAAEGGGPPKTDVRMLVGARISVVLLRAWRTGAGAAAAAVATP